MIQIAADLINGDPARFAGNSPPGEGSGGHTNRYPTLSAILSSQPELSKTSA